MLNGVAPLAIKRVRNASKRTVKTVPCQAVYFPETIDARLTRGWSLENALDYPVIVAEVYQ